MSALLQAPTGAGTRVFGRSGTIYTADAAGAVLITNNGDIAPLLDAGFTYANAQPPLVNFRNLLDGGDFTVNPWQRGTSFATISNTVTYGADRFFAVGGASSNITMSQQANTDVAGFNKSMRFGRTAANTDVAVLNLGQVLETADSIRLQGQEVTLSFYVKAGANFLASSPTFNVALVTGTGTDQSAANMVAGSWTGSFKALDTTCAPTTTTTRFQFTCVIPAAATQVGLLLSYTPSGTAGANEYVEFMGFQLEIGPTATAFEHRDVEVELALCQRYYYQVAEPASGVIVAAGMITAAAVQVFVLGLPTQMRAAPTVTVTVGTFKVNLVGVATVPTTFAAGSTHTPNYISVQSANTGQTAGQATMLQGGGGAGVIKASAEF